MKLRTFRMSGDPVALENREKFQEEFKIVYDKCAERAGLDMLRLNRLVRYCERQLVKKWNAEVLTELPKTAKAWEKVIAQYEDTPLMLARTKDGKGLVLILMDQMQA
ncbi:MAG: hypothetical protein ACAH17_03700 [Candidatus Paceibacterota bacterium]